MDVQIDPKLLSLAATVESDITRVMSEALDLWLKARVPKCPITDSFCENLRGSCNNCPVTNGGIKTRGREVT